jgi:hypothetical protein
MEATQKLKLYKRLIVILTISTLIPSSLLFMSLSPFAPAPADTPQSVSKEAARANIRNFRERPEAVENEVTGIRIEASQLESMNNIKASNPNTSAYRLYFAQDSVGAPLSVVVGVNDDGEDETESIYSTARKGSNLCPPMCDAGSPLTN